MVLTCIGSSSKGNCYVIQNNSEALIIEAGLPLLEAKKVLNWNIQKVVGCLVSHQHGDHAAFAKEYTDAAIPLLAPEETIEAKHLGYSAKAAEHGKCYKLGNFKVIPFNVYHDVPCVGYLVWHKEFGKLFFATDTYAVPYNFNGINHWLIEANYSDEILDSNIISGRVPAVMRDRLMLSHLSIDNAIGVLKRNDLSQTKHIVLLHLSDGNSNEAEFVKAVRRATGKRTVAAKKGVEINLSEL